jgi:hypothetical protein
MSASPCQSALVLSPVILPGGCGEIGNDSPGRLWKIAIGELTRRQLSRGEDFYVYEGLVALTTSRNDPVVLLMGSERIKDGSDAGRRKGEGTPRLWS